MKLKADAFLFTLDLTGTFVFGVEGATAAIRGDLDLLGVMVLSFITALGGGIIRDVLIGAVPPAAMRDWRYGTTALTGGAMAILLSHFVQEAPSQLILSLDAAGLALFAVAGAGKALNFELNPFIAVLLGGITGVGGGTVRDLLLIHVPAVLRTDIYATAALVGAAVMVIGLKLGGGRTFMATLGFLACFVLRMVSIWHHWNLPKIVSR